MRTYLSVAEQLARKRAFVEQLRRETHSAEEVVNAYARAFYRASNDELFASQLEFERARAEGIHPRHAALLYSKTFSHIEAFVYNWMEANPVAAMQVASRTVGLPSLTYAPERETSYEVSHMSHVKKIAVIVKRVGATPYHVSQFSKVIEMIYALVEVFNHSNDLSRREQENMPANLALLSIELKDELPAVLEASSTRVRCLLCRRARRRIHAAHRRGALP